VESKALTQVVDLPAGDAYVASVAGGAPRNITAALPTYLDAPDYYYHFMGPTWDADGNGLYLIGGDTLWHASADGARPRPVTTLRGHHITAVLGTDRGRQAWSPRGRESIYLRIRNAASMRVGVAQVDVRTGHTSILLEEEKSYGGPMPFAYDIKAGTIAYLAEDVRHPRDVWSSSADFQRARRITNANPQLERVAFGSTRMIQWKTPRGELLSGALLLPAGHDRSRRYPTVVFVYGGEIALADRRYEFGLYSTGVDNMQLLATRGYIVFMPDSRERLGTPMRDLAESILAGVDELVRIGIADSMRLGLMGQSHGGYTTLALLVQTTRFKAAVSRQGTSNLISSYGVFDAKRGTADGVDYFERFQGMMGVSPWEDQRRYIENSPFFLLDRVATPLLLVHGADDGVLPGHLADLTFVALRRLGKTVEYARYPEGHHEDDWSYANAKDYVERMIRWFERHLQR
jgi:dipeptidyl aminopeptidase/acylaminoacyl peptidase